MPSPYLTYALGALSFGLSVGFLQISNENADLARDKIAVEMRLETAEADAKSFRDKYSVEVKAREFAEAAETVAETSERVATGKLAQAQKSLEVAQAQLTSAQEQIKSMNAKLVEAGLKAPEGANSATTADGASSHGQLTSEASMVSPRRSWWSIFGF
jgi:hypothetical protein